MAYVPRFVQRFRTADEPVFVALEAGFAALEGRAWTEAYEILDRPSPRGGRRRRTS